MSPSPAPLFTTFRARWGVFLLIAYQAFFLNVVVPGHTRGAITLTGHCSASPLFQCPCCCRSKHDATQHTPTPQDRGDCAICHLASHYMPPTVVTFAFGRFGLVELLPAPRAVAIPHADLHPTYYACGPPRTA